MKQPKNFMRISWDEALRMYRGGYMTERQFKQFHVIWTWSAYRASSKEVDILYDKKGYDAVIRRIDRVRKVLGLKPYLQKEE